MPWLLQVKVTQTHNENHSREHSWTINQNMAILLPVQEHMKGLADIRE